MPCNSDHLRATETERESVRVLKLLTEVGLRTLPFNSYYGEPEHISFHTRQLCNWCRDNKERISSYSLELQMWWRDHQIADAKREEKERKIREENEIKETALSKLTEEEKKVLGV